MDENTELVIGMFITVFVMVFATALAIGLAFYCILMLMKISGLMVIPV